MMTPLKSGCFDRVAILVGLRLIEIGSFPFSQAMARQTLNARSAWDSATRKRPFPSQMCLILAPFGTDQF
jgi:hypothetical protein